VEVIRRLPTVGEAEGEGQRGPNAPGVLSVERGEVAERIHVNRRAEWRRLQLAIAHQEGIVVVHQAEHAGVERIPGGSERRRQAVGGQAARAGRRTIGRGDYEERGVGRLRRVQRIDRAADFAGVDVVLRNALEVTAGLDEVLALRPTQVVGELHVDV